MEVKVSTSGFHEMSADPLIVPIFENESLSDGLPAELNEKTDRLIASLFERREFRGIPNELAYIHHASGLKAHRLVLVGVGKPEKFNENRLRQAAGSAARMLKSKRMQNAAFLLCVGSDREAAAQAVSEGLHLALFDPDSYKTKEQKHSSFEEFFILTDADAQE